MIIYKFKKLFVVAAIICVVPSSNVQCSPASPTTGVDVVGKNNWVSTNPKTPVKVRGNNNWISVNNNNSISTLLTPLFPLVLLTFNYLPLQTYRFFSKRYTKLFDDNLKRKNGSRCGSYAKASYQSTQYRLGRPQNHLIPSEPRIY